MEHEPFEFSAEEPTLAERPRDMTRSALGQRVAVIVADGFEQAELDVPIQVLRDAGVIVEVLAPTRYAVGHIKGVNHFEPADGVQADRAVMDARVTEFDALLIPGGLASPDTMRQSRDLLDFVKAFVDAEKPVAAICHGPWLLADANVITGKTLSSWPGIRRDLERAGASWVNEPVAIDAPFITSRNPDDAKAFGKALVDALAVRAST